MTHTVNFQLMIYDLKPNACGNLLLKSFYLVIFKLENCVTLDADNVIMMITVKNAFIANKAISKEIFFCNVGVFEEEKKS